MVDAERGLSAFIGRVREIELLLDCFERTREGKGQAISIVAEAGIGMFTFGKNKLKVSASSPDAGEAYESLPVKYTGKEIAVAFNPEYVMEPLRTLPDDEVVVELVDELSPGVLKCSTPFLYVLMPMRIT